MLLELSCTVSSGQEQLYLTQCWDVSICWPREAFQGLHAELLPKHACIASEALGLG